MSQVNLDDPKKHRDSNMEVLQTWIDQIMSGAISLDGLFCEFIYFLFSYKLFAYSHS